MAYKHSKPFQLRACLTACAQHPPRHVQALSKQGCAVDFVGGSSSVLVVGGRSVPAGGGGASSNLSVWDTMAPTAASCVGRLMNHQVRAGAAWALGWSVRDGVTLNDSRDGAA